MFITDENAESLLWGAIAFTAATTLAYSLRRARRVIRSATREALAEGRIG